MIANADLRGRELIWQKVQGVSRAREIAVDGESWVRIRRVKMFGSLARVDAAAGAWTLKRVGFFRTRINIRVADSEESVGVFTPSFTWWGSAGTLHLGDRDYPWRATKSFGREHAFLGPGAQPLIRFRGSPRKCRMTIDDPGNESQLPLIAALGYYLIQLHDEDSAAAAAAAAG